MDQFLAPKRCTSVLILIIFGLTFMAGCAADQGDKASINAKLASNEEISSITWSPDETVVLYVQGAQGEADVLQVSAWRVAEKEAAAIAEVASGFLAFTWSPNSQIFLISEALGEGVSNRIFAADTLQQEATLDSFDIPSFNPDSTALAYGLEQPGIGEGGEQGVGDSWGSLQVYHLENGESEFIWKTKGYLYHVEYWDEQGNIGYTEINDQGEPSSKMTQNIKPSISGVQLGDSRDMVIEKLGVNFTESPMGDAAATFIEPVDRLIFEKGYEVFIGQGSGEVVEIMASDPEAQTNLGVGIGASAADVFSIYRPDYIEPESIHGGKLYGIFKVEGAAALVFRFDIDPWLMRDSINPENKVTGMTLTYPNNMDDDF